MPPMSSIQSRLCDITINHFIIVVIQASMHYGIWSDSVTRRPCFGSCPQVLVIFWTMYSYLTRFQLVVVFSCACNI